MRKQQGFTLIELLVALVVFSSIVSITMLAFDQGVNTWQRSINRVSSKGEMLKRESWLYPVYEQSISAYYIYPNGEIGPYFKGRKNVMEFNTASPVLTGPGRNAVVQFKVEEANDEAKLLYRQRFNADIQRGIRWGNQDWHVLLDGVKEIQFRYLAGPHLPVFDSIESIPPQLRKYYREKPEWLDEFEAYYEESLPHRVAFLIKNNDGTDVNWEFPVTYASDALSPMF
ncbi:type II secretion system protein J [Photobacterium rosenbergii]|uniref:PulJ/GspJ family protein n=1 Tax=Photobacterium rosenbergii TaxID=294936 RepID=UPI001C995DA0|nr:prepilin-type N-terminal cleavage/methylation domain-containing protein [Photobacterium rosenbergii]MBY5947377.1 type II secretion system GspH family protein [Photobacterium rosenbergii]